MDTRIISTVVQRYLQDRSEDRDGIRAKQFEADLLLLCQYSNTREDATTLLQACFGRQHNNSPYLYYDTASVKDSRWLEIIARAVPIQYLWSIIGTAEPPDADIITNPMHTYHPELMTTRVILTLTAKVLARRRLPLTPAVSDTIRPLVEPIITAPAETARADERSLAVAVAYLSGLDHLVDTTARERGVPHPWQLPSAMNPHDQYYALTFARQWYLINDLPALLAMSQGAAAVSTIGRLVNEQVLLPHVYVRALQLADTPPTPEQIATLEQWYQLDHPVWVGRGRVDQGQPLMRFIHQLLSAPAQVRTTNLLRWLATELLPNIHLAASETYGGITCGDPLPDDVTALPLLFPLNWRKPLAVGLLNGLQAGNRDHNKNVWTPFVAACFRGTEETRYAHAADAEVLARYLPEPPLPAL